METPIVNLRAVDNSSVPLWRPNLQAVQDLSRKEKVKVKVLVKFHKLGEIDTVNETFKASFSIRAHWREPRLDSTLRKSRRYELRNWRDFWGPSLVLDNAIEEPRQTIWTMVHYNRQGHASIVQTHSVKGTFYENMELRQFPFDTQDLSVTIMSELTAHEVALHCDEAGDGISANDFVNASEWQVYEHLNYRCHNPPPCDIVKAISPTIGSNPPTLWNGGDEERLTDDSGCLEMTSEHKVEDELYPVFVEPVVASAKRKGGPTSSYAMSRPSVTVSCKASRRASFFVFNVILIIMLLGALIFCTFAVDVNLPQHRIAIAFTLLLVHITFKGAVRQSLPKISYLTYLDMYIGFSMLHMALVSAWHAVVAQLVSSDSDSQAAKEADRIAVIVLGAIYLAFNLFFVVFNIVNVQIQRRKNSSRAVIPEKTSEVRRGQWKKTQVVPH